MHKEVIPRLQKGLCSVLSDIFAILTVEKWNALIHSLHQWNGRKESLSEEIENNINYILARYINTYFRSTRETTTIISICWRRYRKAIYQ